MRRFNRCSRCEKLLPNTDFIFIKRLSNFCVNCLSAGEMMSQKRARLKRVWAGMRDRCLNTNNQAYQYYGGKGIKISDEWLKFENFFNDMQANYRNGLTIDRIDYNGMYEKSNCRWATPKEQSENKGPYKKRQSISLQYLCASGKSPLQIIADHLKSFGLPPTMKTFCQLSGLHSTHSAFKFYRALEKEGYLRRVGLRYAPTQKLFDLAAK